MRDNRIEWADYDAIKIQAFLDNDRHSMSSLNRVAVLRNKVREIGARPRRAAHGHAIQVTWADQPIIAGNIVERAQPTRNGSTADRRCRP